MPPVALIESVEHVRRRARWLSLVYGCGVVVAAAAGLLAAVVAIDWLLNLRSTPRVLAMLAALGGLGYLAHRHVVAPALRALSLSDVAGRLERAFPQFEDRLRSTIDFVEGRNPGSALLQQRVMEQAAEIGRTVNLSSAVVARPAMLSAGGAALSILLLMAVSLGMSGQTLSIIGSRLLTPWNAAAWPKRVQIAVTSNVPDRVPVGQKLEVAIRLERGDGPSVRPILLYQIDGGPPQQVYMARGDDGQYRATLDARLDQRGGSSAESSLASGIITARVVAGDDERALAPVTVVPRLTIRRITADIAPPAYATGRPATKVDLAAMPAATAEGSGIALTVGFNKPLGSADPVLEPVGADDGHPAAVPAVAWSRPDPQTAVARFVADKSFRFRVRGTDVDQFANTAVEEYEINVRPDANLSLQLEAPRRSEERTPTAFVPLQAVAEDDVGINWVKLIIERQSPRQQKWEIALVDADRPAPGVSWQTIEASAERVRNRLNYQWELQPLQTQPGDVLEFYLQAQDNFRLGDRFHEPVSSTKLRVTIISPEDMLARVTGELPASKALAGNIRQAQTRAMNETQELAEQTSDKPALDAADRTALERLGQQQSSTAASTKQLAGRLQTSLDKMAENRLEAPDVKSMLEEVKNTLDRASEQSMKEAAGQLNQANQSGKSSEQRNEAMATARQNQQSAIEQLDRVMQRLESVGSLQSSIADLKNLLEAQRSNRKANQELARKNLGKTPEQMSEEDRKKLGEIADEQQRLAERTDRAIDQLDKQSRQMSKSDPSASESMQSAARKGQESKVSQNQRRAAEQTRQNQQASAQNAQKQVELGLEQMLAELNEAERRELARLREQLAQMSEQVAILIRRQAGHNLDNLFIQGPEKLKAIARETLDDLFGKAERQPSDTVVVPIGQVSAAQELTERNARDLAKTADAKPETAPAAAALAKAAGKMERAIVSLRAGKAAEAYDPPQIEALAALLEASEVIEAQKQQADQKAEEQQKDAIRQRYEKVREQQLAINNDTLKVEKSRDKDGNIARVETGTIRKLPDQQQIVADELAKIEEDLTSVGSVVYVWANRDMRATMESIKADLVGLKTGDVTQTNQAHVLAQLDAMIKNLAERPSDGKFENAGGGDSGGDGGGEQAVKMPAEAELRLLKSLQEVVNTTTAKLAAAAEKDKAAHVGLGARQGELRNLLAELLEKSESGMKLGPEPDNKDQLPEEATVEQIDQNELQDMLLGEGAAEKKIEQDFKLVGTRMSRVNQRLAINTDSGKTTQEIERRILQDLDQLIEQAAKNQSGSSSSASAGKGGKAGKPSSSGAQQAGNTGQNQGQKGQQQANADQQANGNGGVGETGIKSQDLKDILESASEWGGITPRERDAIIESKNEQLIEQYRKLIEDYYEALAKSGTRAE